MENTSNLNVQYLLKGHYYYFCKLEKKDIQGPLSGKLP